MKKATVLSICLAGVFFFTSCNQETKPDATKIETAKPDVSQIRSDIVAIETAWAAALNAKDINALMALYADDAMSMQDGGPTLSGKAAIQKQQQDDFAKPAKFASIGFETLDVYGQGDVVTEVGKTMYKDSTGKVREAENTWRYLKSVMANTCVLEKSITRIQSSPL